MSLKFNKINYSEDSICDWCCNDLEPFTLIFKIKNNIYGDLFDYMCLKCAKKEGLKIPKKREKELLEKQKKLQIKYYESKLKKLKEKN